MNIRYIEYVFLVLNVLLQVYIQIITKWQVGLIGPIPASGKTEYFFDLLLRPWIVSAYIAAFLASVFWMAALSKLPLSHAFPFSSLAFVLIMVSSTVFFAEPFTMSKMIGSILIIAGITIASQG